MLETKTDTDPNTTDYENRIQFFGHEEGRTRVIDLPSGAKGLAYDYMLKDHLGNVRLTFTTKNEVEETTATGNGQCGNRRIAISPI